MYGTSNWWGIVVRLFQARSELTEAGAHFVLMEMPKMLCMKPREHSGGWGQVTVSAGGLELGLGVLASCYSYGLHCYTAHGNIFLMIAMMRAVPCYDIGDKSFLFPTDFPFQLELRWKLRRYFFLGPVAAVQYFDG